MTDPAHSLANWAAKFLDATFRIAEANSAPEEAAAAAALHDARKLYPRVTVAAPHGGGAIHLEAVLCDPETDQPVVRVFAGEAVAEVRSCH